MCTDRKKRGNIVIFTVVVASFISWTIFTSSFLLSEEISVLIDKKSREASANREKILNSIFKDYVKNIEKAICSEEEVKDVIWYVAGKNGRLLWVENYDDFIESDKGYRISEIDVNGTVRKYDKNSTNHRYKNQIRNFLKKGRTNIVKIFFVKSIDDVSLEDASEKYSVEISGQLEVSYLDYDKVPEIDDIKSMTLKVMTFDIE